MPASDPAEAAWTADCKDVVHGLMARDAQSTATLTRLLPPNVTFHSQKARAAMCSPMSPAITGPKPSHGS